jgi:tetratricopeptide (TPR) repeat protein
MATFRLCYHRAMRHLAAALIVLLLAPAQAWAADALAEARRLYNAGDFEAAQTAARKALAVPQTAEPARVVLGRILLEQYRRTASQNDLADARHALRTVDPEALDSRERLELTLGLAEALYLEDRFGASAELFEPLIDASSTLGARAHERVLDWWATAMDRQAQLRPRDERMAMYDRIAERMSRELRTSPGSGVAAYWLAAAARGRGDVERAWQAALAGWMRAPQTAERGAALRADLDRLVVQAIIPERIARLGLKDSTQALAGMLGEWEAFKVTWSR